MSGSTVFPFGTPTNDPSKALLLNLDFTVGDTDCWAILSPSSSPTRSHLLSAIQAHTRIHPQGSATYPILKTLPLIPPQRTEDSPREPDVQDIIQFVSFKTRLQSSGSRFQDYTSRYYHIRDGDKLTLREHLTESLLRSEGEDGSGDKVYETARALEMEGFLELPLVTLSNGQTRRARIIRSLLTRPELLILEEPFTGLDVGSRAILSRHLASLHALQTPRIFLVLRPQDEIPSFVSHLALVGTEANDIVFGLKEDVLASEKGQTLLDEREKMLARQERRKAGKSEKGGKVLLKMEKVNVSYGPRRVLLDVDWTVREGERWVLSGHNGSGKSTLLAMLLGDHPLSFGQPITVFGRPRIDQATSTIQANIGHVSPEIFNAFPRRFDAEGLTAQEAIITGFESIYAYRKITPSQQALLSSLITDIAHPIITPSFLSTDFAALSPGEQSLVLLLRALVKRPALLVLDEPFAGMDKEMVDIVKKFLDTKLRSEQAVILISHFEEEVPDSFTRLIKLDAGRVVEIV